MWKISATSGSKMSWQNNNVQYSRKAQTLRVRDMHVSSTQTHPIYRKLYLFQNKLFQNLVNLSHKRKRKIIEQQGKSNDFHVKLQMEMISNVTKYPRRMQETNVIRITSKISKRKTFLKYHTSIKFCQFVKGLTHVPLVTWTSSMAISPWTPWFPLVPSVNTLC